MEKCNDIKNFYRDFKGIGGFEIIHKEYDNRNCDILQLLTFFKYYLDRKFHSITHISDDEKYLNTKIIFDYDEYHTTKNISCDVANIIRRQIHELDNKFVIRLIPYKELIL